MPRKNQIVLSGNRLVRPRNAPRKKTQRKAKKGVRGRKSSFGRIASTSAGIAFQKCTLAPADFTDTGFSGIPDEFDGQVISKRHTVVGTLPTVTAGHDLYLVQLPIPGVAYFYGDRVAGGVGAITLTAVYYDDSATLFNPTGAKENANVTSFRYASNVLEFIPTVNAMNWAGSIEAWKSKVTMTEAGTTYVPVISGLAETLNTLKSQSVFAVKDGIYAPSFNTEATYEWEPIQVGMTMAQQTINQSAGNALDATITLSGTTANFTGLGTMQCTVIKFASIDSHTTGKIRAWACVEYQCTPGSILYDYTHMSPMYDPTALAAVKAYHKAIPCAVSWKENATFWENFLKWAGIAAEAVSYLPGPVGLIGKGFSELLPKRNIFKGGLF